MIEPVGRGRTMGDRQGWVGFMTGAVLLMTAGPASLSAQRPDTLFVGALDGLVAQASHGRRAERLPFGTPLLVSPSQCAGPTCFVTFRRSNFIVPLDSLVDRAGLAQRQVMKDQLEEERRAFLEERRAERIHRADSSRAARDAEAAAAQRALEIERAAESRRLEDERIRKIDGSGWGARFKEAARQRQIMLGMPSDAVELAWGPPEGVNTSVSSAGRREQWVYPGHYVYLVNGVVESWQSFR